MDALVTDVHASSAVAGLRGLGRAGLEVIALGPGRAAPGRWSRYAAARAIGRSDVGGGEALIEAVARMASDNGDPLVVYPGGEQAISALLAAPGLPSQVVFPYPPSDGDALWALRDKRRLPALAKSAGFRVPHTLFEGTARELTRAPVKTPCVVKPATSGGGEPASASIVETLGELQGLAAKLHPEAALIVQERLGGKLVHLALVVGRRGETVARFQQDVVRTWPAAAGAASLAVSVPADDSLAERARRMLADAGYWGLAQLDIIETADGPAVIDVNPRFYTSLPLAMACGVNLPGIWHSVATGNAVIPAGPYRLGMTYRWLEADATAAIRGSPRVLLKRTPAPRAGAMWARDDPMPSLLLALRAVGTRLRRRLPVLGDGW